MDPLSITSLAVVALLHVLNYGFELIATGSPVKARSQRTTSSAVWTTSNNKSTAAISLLPCRPSLSPQFQTGWRTTLHKP